MSPSSKKEVLPVIGYPISHVEFDVNKLKDVITVNGRRVTAQRMAVVAPNIVTGEQERTEYVVPTSWCYRQVKEHHIAKQRLNGHHVAETTDEIIEVEVTGDADEGGDVVRRSDGWAESSSAGELG